MTGILGGANAISKPTIVGLQISTSASGLPIPVVYGVHRAGCNLIQYENFQILKAKQAGGKGGLLGSNSGYIYSADVILAICEGPIFGINLVWKNGQVTDLANVPLNALLGTYPQAVADFITTDAPTRALGYQGTAWAGVESYQLGGSPSVPQHEFEVQGFGFVENWSDVPPVATTLAVGITLGGSTITVAPATGQFIYPGMVLGYNGATPLNPDGMALNTPYYIEVLNVAGDVVTLAADVIDAQVADLLVTGATVSFSLLDGNPWHFLVDILTSPNYGLDWDLSLIGDMAPYRNYCRAQGLFLSPIYDNQEQLTSIIDRLAVNTNSWIFWNGTQVVAVPLADADVSGNGVTFHPNIDPVYDLTYEDLIIESGQMPIEVTRKDPSDAYNALRVEIDDRCNRGYQPSPVEAKDQGSIGLYGQINAPSLQGRDICSPTVGNTIVNLLLQRYLYIRNEYTFKLGPEFVILQVGDVVTLTDPNIGLTAFAVRIKQIDEDDKYILTITAEEVPGGSQIVPPGRIRQQNPSTGHSTPPTQSQANPGDVNAPILLEPSTLLTGGVPQVWAVVSGASPVWGGCNVLASIDNVNYYQIGTINGEARQGLLTGALNNHADPDTVDTLAVDLTESRSAINTAVTPADADALQTLAIVGQEIVAYGHAALTSTAHYNLTYLRRGQYGTTPVTHAVGTPFGCLDEAVFKHDLPAEWLCRTLYFKFQSFNVYGLDLEPVSDCVVYPFTPTGSGFGGGLCGVPSAPTGVTASALPSGVLISWSPNAPADHVTSYQVWRASGLGASFGGAVQIAGLSAGSTTYTDISAVAGLPYTYFIVAVNVVGPSAPSAGVSVTAYGAGAIQPLVNGDLPIGVILDPLGQPVGVIV